jgi:hypothetical protein
VRERDVLRGLDAVLRGFDAVLPDFDALLRDDFAAPPVERVAVERFAGDLRVPEERLAPALADLARVEVDLRAVDPLLRDVEARERDDDAFVDPFAVERFAVDLRAPLDRPELARDEDDDDPLLPPLAEPSIDHLPDITRCAASATASAMIDPSLVALDATALAACEAVSAASSPASRIFLRAAGLALIAAAAAASPAASISLLIAAFASLSIVSPFDRERDEDAREPAEDERERDDVDREELLRGDFAISHLPPFVGKDTLGLFRFPNEVAICKVVARERPKNASATDMLKGTAASRSDALRHGQRPEMWPFVST